MGALVIHAFLSGMVVGFVVGLVVATLMVIQIAARARKGSTAIERLDLLNRAMPPANWVADIDDAHDPKLAGFTGKFYCGIESRYANPLTTSDRTAQLYDDPELAKQLAMMRNAVAELLGGKKKR